jgi:YjbE family integral membrane protein
MDNLHALLADGSLWVLSQVVVINFVLSGDNAIVVGMAASGLPAGQRQRAMWLGIMAATALRVVFSVVATQLLQILGLALAGAILLLWVAWKLWRELRERDRLAVSEAEALIEGRPFRHAGAKKTLRAAIWQIVVADVSMSLDNALAVAGAAMDHPVLLIIGLGTSVVLMGVAAALVARLLERYHWIAYVGLAIVVYVALKMMWEGAHQVAAAL